MSWSVWLQDPPKTRGSATVAEIQKPYGSVDVVSEIIPYWGNVYSNSTWGTTSDNQWFVAPERTFAVTTPQSDWQAWRDWFPDALDPLTFGQDYGIIPGKTIDDDDRFVEYESGVNVVAGWVMPNVTSIFELSEYGPPAASILVEIVTGLTPPPTGSATAFPSPGSGTALVTHTTDSGFIFTTTTPSDPGPVSSIGLFVSDPTWFGADPNHDRYYSNGTAQWDQFLPLPRLTLPRYRYWTPDSAYLWNAQRTGGGGRSAGRGRGNTTQQGSCRNRGGIH